MTTDPHVSHPPASNVDALAKALTDDMRETGEHLRETDKKVALVVQLYGGFIAVLGTLASGLLEGNVIRLDTLSGPPAIAPLTLLVISSWWVFLFTLRSREHKRIYVNRMNFVRREIHEFLGNPHSDWGGYWSHPLGMAQKPEEKKTLRVTVPSVGLDELYPFGLAAVILLLTILLALVVANGLPPTSSPSTRGLVIGLSALTAATLLCFSATKSSQRVQSRLRFIWDEKGRDPAHQATRPDDPAR